MNDPTPIGRKNAQLPVDPAAQAERQRQWREENAAAIASSNEWLRKHGMPLAKFRRF